MKNWIITALLTTQIYSMDFWTRGTVKQDAALAAGLFVVIAMMVWAADWKAQEMKERRKWSRQ